MNEWRIKDYDKWMKDKDYDEWMKGKRLWWMNEG